MRGGRTEIAEDHWGGEIATLALDPDMLDPDATAGLAEFSHLKVVFHFHLEHQVRCGAAYPRGNPAWPQGGAKVGQCPGLAAMVSASSSARRNPDRRGNCPGLSTG